MKENAMNYKTIMLCAIVAGMMQNTWGAPATGGQRRIPVSNVHSREQIEKPEADAIAALTQQVAQLTLQIVELKAQAATANKNVESAVVADAMQEVQWLMDQGFPGAEKPSAPPASPTS